MLIAQTGEHLERRRTIRIKRSALLTAKLGDIDRPAIKIAETRDELIQAFGLVYAEYLRCGYIRSEHASRLSYNIYNYLPQTCVFVFKSYLDVVSTLTQIFDSPMFGLPMDCLYRRELDQLRGQDRLVVELSALTTPKESRWRNLIVFLCRAMFHYSLYTGVNDLCIMVNPKHVNFYKTIFLFDDFGPERFYDKVGAPAVALRLNLDHVEEKLRETYLPLDFDCDLFSFFYRTNRFAGDARCGPDGVRKLSPLDLETVLHLHEQRPDILVSLSPPQREYVCSVYPCLAAAPLRQ
jgi:hypothetical protein